MESDRTAVIVAAFRTPIGKEGGVYESVRSEDLSIPLLDAILDHTGLDPTTIDDLRWGCAQQRGEQDNNLARVIALLSSLGESTPATTINRWCASSMEALATAADAIRCGWHEAIIAGGVESMTRIPMEESIGSLHPELGERYSIADLQMGMTAEKVAAVYDIEREAQDRFALESHERAAAATREGRFATEIVPVEVDGDCVMNDEGIRPESDIETLGALAPVFRSDGTVTAGNASQRSDGAAATLVTSAEFAARNELPVLAEIGASNVVGVDPTVMGIGPVPATEGLLETVDRTIEEYGLVEINEAFASQAVYAMHALDVPRDRLNVNGGAIALGHPLGATGARLPVTLLHEMRRRDVDRGLATLCVGFGQGMAIEFARDSK